MTKRQLVKWLEAKQSDASFCLSEVKRNDNQ